MFRRFSLLLSLIMVLTSVAPVLAQGPITPYHTDPTWHVQYWNNTSLTGTPVLDRTEENINYDWGYGSPHSSVPTDNFSARWAKYIDVTAGTYRFVATSDDGVRVWVDNELIIDRWYDHAVETHTADKYLSAGHHWVVVEYYENGGLAVMQFQWVLSGQGSTGSGWRGEYYNNQILTGSPVLVRDDAAINFDWGTGSPAPGQVDADHFSVRWTRTMNMSAGMYHFTVSTDDGTRLWVNGHLLVDAWYDQAPRTYTGDIYLPGGQITLKMEYYENGGGAVAKLSWNGGGTGPNPTPITTDPTGTVIIDDTDTAFSIGGNSSGWRTVNEGYGGRQLWTYNSDRVYSNYNWARWTPYNLQSRWYEVYVYIPDRYTTTAQARYWVYHANGYDLRIVDQSAHGGQWVSLGTYYFNGGGYEYVSLADLTYEPYRSRLIGFDALKWVPR
ncbi:MAG: hypothetical protein JW981_08685 [Anaerolineae bacterium]|nr:hypothetical protein [Anaerolineae bacterium]